MKKIGLDDLKTALGVTSCYSGYIFDKIGWYRIAEIDTGSNHSFACTISIKRSYNVANNECHKVEIVNTYLKYVIKPIYDKSNVSIIDKIRCVKVGEDYGTRHYIDIHQKAKSMNALAIIIDNTVASGTPSKWHMFSGDIVPETAENETVVATMDFGENTWLGQPL